MTLRIEQPDMSKMQVWKFPLENLAVLQKPTLQYPPLQYPALQYPPLQYLTLQYLTLQTSTSGPSFAS